MDQLKIYLYIGALFFSFSVGMYVQSEINEKDLLEASKQESLNKTNREKDIAAVATKVLDGLRSWEQNKELITKEIRTEKTKPVFINVCVSPEYVGMFNKNQILSRAIISGEPSTGVQK